MLVNKGSYDFIDISNEEWREYSFPNKEKILIENCTHLAISKSGHRLLDHHGISHFIPFGWLAVRWKAKPGAAHFVK